MSSDTDLPNQPDNFQQPHLMKKGGNSSWKAFFILLIIFNILFIWLSPFTFLLPFAIIDSIAVSSYIKKQSPPWKAFLIAIFAINVIFFLMAGWTLSQSAGAVAGLLIIPFALILLIIDSIAILCYIKKTR